MPRCAFLTMDGIEAYPTYDHLAVEPLARRGWRVTMVPWRDRVDWDAYAVVCIRSPWDYFVAPEAFLAVLGEIEASAARLANPLAVVRWNLNKGYLRDLDARGVPIVPTRWGTGTAGLDAAFEAFGTDEIVVKPTVSGGAQGAFRLRRSDRAGRAQAGRELAGRETMTQPFVPSVVDEGEVSLFHFGGAFSHAILKTPAPRDFRVQEEHGGVIRAVEPEPALLAASEGALRAARDATGVYRPLPYARTDWVRLGDGTWAAMELELIEPSLYFPHDAESSERFADALVAWASETA